MRLLLPWKLKTKKVTNSHIGIQFEEHKIIDARGNEVLEITDKALGEEIVKRINLTKKGEM